MNGEQVQEQATEHWVHSSTIKRWLAKGWKPGTPPPLNLERARDILENTAYLLRDLEWSGYDGAYAVKCCPECSRESPRSDGSAGRHKKSCRLRNGIDDIEGSLEA